MVTLAFVERRVLVDYDILTFSWVYGTLLPPLQHALPIIQICCYTAPRSYFRQLTGTTPI